jgi:arylsulfatase
MTPQKIKLTRAFGSNTQTPVLDKMAKDGLKMTNFYNASRCCPTRASLMTGLFQHQAGVGDMMNTRPEAAYQGYLNQNCVTIAEALKAGGYATGFFQFNQFVDQYVPVPILGQCSL